MRGILILRNFENPDTVNKKKLLSMFAKNSHDFTEGTLQLPRVSPYGIQWKSTVTNTFLTVLKMPRHVWILEGPLYLYER